MFKMKHLLFVVFLHAVAADMYLHNPPGSNDRNRERNDNRNNANRLFDSQNNAAGGYPWRGDPETLYEPDPITYYIGSRLRVEWANQHACGPNTNVFCNVIIQYACEDIMPGLRDGYPTGDAVQLDAGDAPDQYWARSYRFNQDGGDTDTVTRGDDRIPDGINDINTETGLNILEGEEDRIEKFYSGDISSTEGKAGVEYGMNEDYEYYQRCKSRERNKGLYTADQQINGDDARFTRQNTNGNRHGFECTEERDYYPYWSPAPWKDIVVMPPSTQYCDYYRSRSRNVKPVGWCDCTPECTDVRFDPIEEALCSATGGNWKEEPAWEGLGPPDCKVHAYGADNHLGFAHPMDGDDKYMLGGAPVNAFYNLEIPQDMGGEDPAEGQLCVLRLRYNISTADYVGHEYLVKSNQEEEGFFDHRYNCPNVNGGDGGVDDNVDTLIENHPQCYDDLQSGSVPLYDRPYIKVFNSVNELSIAQNTDQIGRTFQDRTHVFHVKKRPNNIPGDARIWNLNTRGRRGNIVQAYPSTEYIFVPDRLVVQTDDYISIQLHGSDFNAAKNPNNGEGWQFSDRFNMIQLKDSRGNFPRASQDLSFFKDNDWKDLLMPPFDPPETGQYQNLKMSDCVDYKDYNAAAFDNTDYDNVIVNCGKLNHAGNLLQKDIKVTASDGEYYYVDTRNNNFSNRSHKGCFIVDDSLSDGAIAGIAIAVAAVVIGVTAFAIYKFRGGGVGSAASV